MVATRFCNHASVRATRRCGGDGGDADISGATESVAEGEVFTGIADADKIDDEDDGDDEDDEDGNI